MKSERKVFSSKNAQGGRFRRSLLATACLVVVSGPVLAQSTSYITGGSPLLSQGLTVSGYAPGAFVNNQQYNGSPTAIPVLLAASLNNVGEVIFFSGGGGSTLTLPTNSQTAIAGSNWAINTGPLSLASTSLASGQVSGGNAAGGTQATSLISNSKQTITLVNRSAADTATVSGNSLAAETILNNNTSTLSGSLPLGYSNGTDGAVAISTNGTAVAVASNAGGVTISTNQISENSSERAGSSATASGSTVGIDISKSAATPLSAPLSVNANTVSATFDANLSKNTISVADNSPAVSTAMSVENMQINWENNKGGNLPGATSSVTNTAVGANLTDRSGGVQTVTSAVTVDANKVTSASNGNSTSNTITLGQNVDLYGASSATQNVLTGGATTLGANVGADLAVVNAQADIGTRVISTMTNSVVNVLADNTSSTATIAVNSNNIASTANGNLAVNSIGTTLDSKGNPTTANFDGSVAAANQQVTNMASGNAIYANILPGVGTPGAQVNITVGAANNTVSGTLTTNDNSITAAAAGNAASTTVDIAATNIVTPMTTGTSTSNTIAAAPTITTIAGVTATNDQSTFGSTNIRGELDTGSVTIDATQPVSGLTASVNGNTLSGSAVGNSAGTGISLTGTVVTTTAAVASVQTNQNDIRGIVNDAGTQLKASAAVTGSDLSVNTNQVDASAFANSATNGLTVDATKLTVGAAGSFTNIANTTLASSSPLSVTNDQNTSGTTKASNTLDSLVPYTFAQVNVGGAISSSTLTTDGNRATSTAADNFAANTMDITASNSLGVSGGVAGPVAGITNLQQSSTTADTATLSRSGGVDTPLIGIQYNASVAGSKLSVTDNTLQASTIGNWADSNALTVSSDSFATAAAAAGNPVQANSVTPGASASASPFSVVSVQSDASSTRSSSVDRASVGIEDNGTPVAISGSNLSASSNLISAQAQNNYAKDNSITLSGFSSFTGGAGLANEQNSAATTSATVTNSRVRIQARDGTVSGSNIDASLNKIEAVASGNSATNQISASSTNSLDSNDTILAGNQGGAVNGAGTVYVGSDFGLANSQSQTGAVSASATGTVRINMTGSTLTTGGTSETVTLDNNTIRAIAQSNSAGNAVNLSSPNITTTAGIASSQNATGPVSASLNPVADGVTFGVMALSATGTPVTINGNAAVAAAGQNDVTNFVTATGDVVNGRGFNTAPTVGIPTTQTDYSITNVQSGGGLVGATAVPGTIGTVIPTISGTSVTVDGNTVLAQAVVNNTTPVANPGGDPLAGNQMILGGGTTLSATGAVNSVQTATNSTVTATAGALVGPATVVGVTGATTLTDVNSSVNNNTVAAIGNENTASNSLIASATTISNPVGNTSTTFSVLNSQSGAGSVKAEVLAPSGGTNVIGVQAGTLSGGTVAVDGNVQSASATVNNATNSLALNAGSTLTATGLVQNSQSSSATGTANINGGNAGVTYIGVFGVVDTSALATSVTANKVQATAGGNTAINSLEATANATISGSAGTTFQILNGQTNTGAMNASITNQNVGVFFSGAGTGPATSVGGNLVTASGYGNQAGNMLTTSSLLGASNAGSSGIFNNQLNTASITTTITGVTIGVTGGSQTGGAVSVSGNSVTAQAIGNTAVNTLVAK